MGERTETTETYGRLYEQAERFLARWFEDAINSYEESRLRQNFKEDAHASAPESSEKKKAGTVEVPLKELAIATIILRRLQDGRRALEAGPNPESQGEASELTKTLLEKFNSLASAEENSDESDNGDVTAENEI